MVNWDEGGNSNSPYREGGEGTGSGLEEGGIMIIVFWMPGESASRLDAERGTTSAIDEPSEGPAMLCTGPAAAPSFSREAG